MADAAVPQFTRYTVPAFVLSCTRDYLESGISQVHLKHVSMIFCSIRQSTAAFVALTFATFCIGQTKTLQIVVHGKSVQLRPSNPTQVPGVGTVTSYFSTYNGNAGSLLIDSRTSTVSGELRPRASTPGLYEGGYGQVTPVAVVDYGSYAVSIPTADADSNGIPDLIQYDRAGSFTASGSGFSAAGGLTFSISVQFSRSAGSATGTYTSTTQNSAGQSNAVSGVYSLLSYQGTATYQRTSTNTLNISITGLFQNSTTLTGSTTYTTSGPDQLSYAAFTARDSTGTNYSIRAGGLTRDGNVYRGDLSLVDGMPQTSWADFLNYAFQFTDLNDADGDGIPDLTDPQAGQAPLISTQPRTQTVSINQNVTLTVSASNATAYQWTKNGAAIAGATTTSLTFTRVQLSDGGSYSVNVSNGSGTTASSVAVLTVAPSSVAPAFTVNPLSLTVRRGSSFMLTASASGFPTPTYTWRRAGTTIAGATGPSLLVTNAGTTNSGAYTCVATNSVSAVTSSSATITVSDSTNGGRLSNLSIRIRAGSGAETLITGFSIGGAGTQGSKSLLIRSVGPSLAQFSVQDALLDPLLTVYSGTNPHSWNDNWGGSAEIKSMSAQVGAFSLASDGSQDAAIYAPGLFNGTYTAHTTSGGGSGIALVEIYDTTSTAAFTNSTPRLTNVSARAQVETGAGILIAGFVVSGSTAQTLLIRGIGPTLANFGVQGSLIDPQLAVYSGTRLIGANDDWGNNTTVTRTTANVGGFALSAGGKDAALLITLQPGSYTVQMSGVSSSTGVGLIELYEVTNITP